MFQPRIGSQPKWGMAGRIVGSVVLLFGLLVGALGMWVARLATDIFLSEARDRVTTVDQAVWQYAFLTWDQTARILSNPVWGARLRPLIEAGNADAVTRALRAVVKGSNLHVVRAFDATGNPAGASSDAAAGALPPALQGLGKGMVGKASPETRVVALPGDVLSYEGLSSVGPRPASGRVLAAVMTAPMLDDFGTPFGHLVGFRFLNGDEETIKQLANASGADVTFVLDGTRVATSLRTTDGKGLSGTPVAPSRAEVSRETVGGASYVTHYHTLQLPASEGSGLVAISLQISKFAARSAAIRYKVLAAGVAAVAVFAVVLSFLIRRSLRAVPLMLEHMEAVSGGQLGSALTVDTGDEMQTLAAGVNRTVAKLRDLVGEVESSFRRVEQVSAGLLGTADSLAGGAARERDVILSLDRTTESLTAVVEKVDAEVRSIRTSATDSLASLQELSASVGEVADGAGNLAEASMETASAMEEMAASSTASASNVATLSDHINVSAASMGQLDQAIRSVFELTEKTRELAKSVSESASVDGRDAMERAKREMAESSQRVAVLGQTVKAVGERSQQIGEIITLISGIADQTKLLALNAAILAAQAGDRGLGFAVVAGQIRELSEQTNASAKTVADLISSIQHESTQAVKEAKLGAEAVTKSKEEVARVAGALERIIAGAAETRDLTQRIALLTQEQSSSSSQVARALSDVAAMAEQIATAAHQQDATGQHVLSIAEEMGARAGEMRASTERQTGKVTGIRDQVEATAAIADRLGSSASATKDAANVLRESVEVIRQVASENQGRAEALQESIERLSNQSEQVRAKLSTFVLG